MKIAIRKSNNRIVGMIQIRHFLNDYQIPICVSEQNGHTDVMVKI